MIPDLRLMSRPDCELCLALVEALHAVPGFDPARLEVIDIDGEPALQLRYHFRIPVLLAGETEIWAGPPPAAETLAAALARATS